MNTSTGITKEQTASGTVTYTNTPTGKLVAQHIGGATYYYLFDGQGSVVGLTDSGGNLVARYLYDPYGQTVEKSGAAADGNPFRYIGGYLDATGLYKLGERYYDPSRGRFLQLDPNGGGYVYAHDNPINEADDSGLDPYDLVQQGDQGQPVFTARRLTGGSIGINLYLPPGYTPNYSQPSTLYVTRQSTLSLFGRQFANPFSFGIPSPYNIPFVPNPDGLGYGAELTLGPNLQPGAYSFDYRLPVIIGGQGYIGQGIVGGYIIIP